jgi:hypothetical protein
MAIITKGKQFAGAHWYTGDGHPAHAQFRNDDRGTRPTTIKDAKFLHLYPSVTRSLASSPSPAWRTGRSSRPSPRPGPTPPSRRNRSSTGPSA